jgi:undecaprenyl-diphosphatase
VAAGAVLAARRREKRVALETALSAWVADALALALSYMIGRQRPCAGGRTALVECPRSPSLPSDHAATAVAAAATLSGYERRLRIPLFAAAALVGASRVRVGVHHPSDVAAGALLGSAVQRLLRNGLARAMS